jgi:MFS family permease
VAFGTGAITARLLSWAAGAVLSGWATDRVGRKRALFASIAGYALGIRLWALVSRKRALARSPPATARWLNRLAAARARGSRAP